VGFSDVEDPTFSRQSAHRWLLGCHPYAPAALYLQKYLLVFISVRGWVNSWAIVWLENVVEKREGRRTLGRFWCRLQVDSETDIKETEYEVTEWSHVTK
jgi:hypothetical protein